jgi:hypothetical protein
MTALPEARVSHFATGRLRVKIPGKRHDEEFFAEVAERLSDWDSVNEVKVNPLTASVLVFFEDAAALFAENALKNDLFSVAFDELEAAAGAISLGEQAAAAIGSVDRAIRRWSAGTADLRGALFAALLAGGMYQLLRGNIAAPAVTLFWYALETVSLPARRDRRSDSTADGG